MTDQEPIVPRITKNSGVIRRIPEARLDDDFTPPRLIHSSPFPTEDVTLIRSLQGQLVNSGVITSDVAMSEDTEQTLEDLISVLREANSHAKSERDFNPEFYDKSAEQVLDDEDENRELSGQDFENEILDGLDDYGNKVYDDGQEQVKASFSSHQAFQKVPEGLPHVPDENGTHETEHESPAAGNGDGSARPDGNKVRVRLPDGTEIIGEIVL